MDMGLGVLVEEVSRGPAEKRYNDDPNLLTVSRSFPSIIEEIVTDVHDPIKLLEQTR